MAKQVRPLGLILGLAALCMAACKPNNETGPGAEKQVFRHALDGAPRSLDPAHASNIYANFLVTNLYDTLYRYKYLARPYELTPNLANGLPEVSADGLTYVIRLKPDVHFSDDAAFDQGLGRPVEAEDFVYSIKRHFDPETLSRGAWLWQGRIEGLEEWQQQGSDYSREVSGLRALDAATIQIKLLQPYPQFIHTLTQGYAAVVPREAVAHYGREFSVKPVGSGPFKLASIDSTKAVLDKNPQFRREPFSLAAEGYSEAVHGFTGISGLEGKIPPFSDQVEIHFIEEDAARWNTFISGEIDSIRAPAVQFDSILATRDPIEIKPELAEQFHLSAALETGLVRIDMNMANPEIGHHPDPEQDQRNRALRCAMHKAFDWQARNRAFYYDLAQVFPGVIPPTVPEFDPESDYTTVIRDISGARQLLTDNGWTGETLPELEYGYYSNVTQRQMFEQFRAFMGDIGYPREKITGVSYASFGDYSRAFKTRQVDLIPAGWTMDFPDAENLLQLYYGPNETPGSNNANYRNDHYDRLYQQSAVMPPSPERTALYRQMNRILIDDCVTFSGISRTLILMWNKRAAIYPDRSFVGGFFVRFAAVNSL